MSTTKYKEIEGVTLSNNQKKVLELLSQTREITEAIGKGTAYVYAEVDDNNIFNALLALEKNKG